MKIIPRVENGEEDGKLVKDGGRREKEVDERKARES